MNYYMGRQDIGAVWNYIFSSAAGNGDGKNVREGGCWCIGKRNPDDNSPNGKLVLGVGSNKGVGAVVVGVDEGGNVLL